MTSKFVYNKAAKAFMINDIQDGAGYDHDLGGLLDDTYVKQILEAGDFLFDETDNAVFTGANARPTEYASITKEALTIVGGDANTPITISQGDSGTEYVKFSTTGSEDLVLSMDVTFNLSVAWFKAAYDKLPTISIDPSNVNPDTINRRLRMTANLPIGVTYTHPSNRHIFHESTGDGEFWQHGAFYGLFGSSTNGLVSMEQEDAENWDAAEQLVPGTVTHEDGDLVPVTLSLELTIPVNGGLELSEGTLDVNGDQLMNTAIWNAFIKKFGGLSGSAISMTVADIQAELDGEDYASLTPDNNGVPLYRKYFDVSKVPPVASTPFYFPVYVCVAVHHEGFVTPVWNRPLLKHTLMNETHVSATARSQASSAANTAAGKTESDPEYVRTVIAGYVLIE